MSATIPPTPAPEPPSQATDLRRVAWTAPVGAVALIVTVALVVILYARGGVTTISNPTPPPAFGNAVATETAQAGLVPPQYNANGMGPCARNVQQRAAGAARWSWSTDGDSDSTVSCPAASITRLGRYVNLSFDGFQNIGFPQNAQVSVTVTFHPTQAQYVADPNNPPTEPPSAESQAATYPCITIGVYDTPSKQGALDSLLLCNDRYYQTLSITGSGQTQGWVDPSSSYTLNIVWSPASVGFVVNGVEVMYDNSGHAALGGLSFSTQKSLPPRTSVDLQYFSVMPLETVV